MFSIVVVKLKTFSSNFVKKLFEKTGKRTSNNTSNKTLMNRGLTMVEVIIVITILALLMLLALSLFPKQIEKARDARRKSDLGKIKVVFEDYYNDNGCYPEQEILDDCGGAALAPRLNAVPCDPATGQPYVYVPESECKGYRIYASLEKGDDPVITELGCDASDGCGLVNIPNAPEPPTGEDSDYNYGVSEGVPVRAGDRPAGTPTPTPSPTAAPAEGWCCAFAGDQCNYWHENYGNCIDGPYQTVHQCVSSTGCVLNRAN